MYNRVAVASHTSTLQTIVSSYATGLYEQRLTIANSMLRDEIFWCWIFETVRRKWTFPRVRRSSEIASEGTLHATYKRIILLDLPIFRISLRRTLVDCIRDGCIGCILLPRPNTVGSGRTCSYSSCWKKLCLAISSPCSMHVSVATRLPRWRTYVTGHPPNACLSIAW